MPYQADAVQAEIIQALRSAGCSVAIIGGANGNSGVPDLLVGWLGLNVLLEVKTPKQRGRSAGRLSAIQQVWHQNWRGQVAVVYTAEEALRVVGLLG